MKKYLGILKFLLVIFALSNLFIIPATASPKNDPQSILENTAKNVKTTQTMIDWMQSWWGQTLQVLCQIRNECISEATLAYLSCWWNCPIRYL